MTLAEKIQEIEQVENELRNLLREGHYVKFETYCCIRDILQKERGKLWNID